MWFLALGTGEPLPEAANQDIAIVKRADLEWSCLSGGPGAVSGKHDDLYVSPLPLAEDRSSPTLIVTILVLML